MRKVFLIQLMVIMMFFSIVDAKNKTKKITIHPTFKHLLKTQPRNSKIVYPMIPRMSGKIAYKLYNSKKAVIFAVAGDNLRKGIIVGAIPLPKKKEMNPLILKKLKKLKNKYIVLY